MKKTLIYIVLSFLALGLVSCNFLDRQEDEQMTFEKIWQQRSTTRQYFFNCMGYLPNDATNFYGGTVIHGASDESSMTWNYPYRYINFGSWNATVIPNDNFNYYYQGIRDCNIFLKNVYTCSDPAATKADLDLWYNCVRWTRAYLYFLLMRDYGPIFLMGDDVIDTMADAQELQFPRNTWDECVDYVCNEMKELSDVLADQNYNATYMGLPTRGAALAVISRLKLYSARPLFNGNRMYRNLINTSTNGKNIFPVEFDAQKWVQAAQAAYDVISMGVYSLYKDKDHPTNAYLNYYGVFQETWNDELIYCGGGYTSRWAIGIHSAPSDIASGDAYCGWGPTQQQVDAYAMASGRYPITGYTHDGTPIIDPDSGYQANEFELKSVRNPFLTALDASDEDATSQSPAMFFNREPRFYVNNYWPGCSWKHGTEYGRATFASGGKGNSGSQNYPKSGYLVNKWYDHSLDTYSTGSWGNITYPTFRYAEILLNYIEATLECVRNGVTGTNVDQSYAMALWDALRARSGMNSILASYPGADVAELIELVHRERRVELAHEGHRYYDTRTWLIAMETDGGPMYGLNIKAQSNLNADNPPTELWARRVFETRVFKPQHYLYPFLQRELDRNKNLVQNYEW